MTVDATRFMTSRFLLFVASAALSIVVSEGLLRSYEQLFLIHSIDPTAAVYDLDRYDYNDHEGFLEHARARVSFGS